MAKVKWPLTKVVEVAWTDACSRSGWSSADDYLDHSPVPVVSVGYLFKESKKEIVIMQNLITTETDCCGAIAIPRAWVKSIKVLRK